MRTVVKQLTLLLVLLFVSCTALEILPGLCYTDKEGTYLCPPEQSITRSANELRADFSNTIY